jgi:3-hydroxyacyl-[acyl-carrier-protein] dehydratase
MYFSGERMTINISKRLHHRKPYLLIDEVIEHSNMMIHARSIPAMEDYYLQGHFPGAPVVPGAMMQEMTTQAAGLLIAEYYSPVPDYDSSKTQGHALGVLRTIHHAKYKSFARPQDILSIKVELIQVIENSFRFKASIEIGDNKIMFNEFTLVNISDEKLKGI